MYFFIDGYNLLFTCGEEGRSLQNQRDHLIQWIRSEFGNMRLKGALVFDGSHRRDEESGLSYQNPLELVYTPKGQSADEYIIEQLERLKNCKSITVVTNDQGLRKIAGALKANVQSNRSFLTWLAKRSKRKKGKLPVIRETSQQIERLIKIFEERLKHDLEE